MMDGAIVFVCHANVGRDEGCERDQLLILVY